jgi:hypothetical protein
MDEEAKKDLLGSPEAKEMFMKRITIAGNLVRTSSTLCCNG